MIVVADSGPLHYLILLDHSELLSLEAVETITDDLDLAERSAIALAATLGADLLPHRPARNVLVHKFVCRGTVEEKIDQLIDSKRQLSQDLLEGGREVLLTEMKDDDLLKLVALDLHTASME